MATVEQPSFGAVLKKYRHAAALSQVELAQRAGLTAQAISTLERGVRRLPQWATVRLLASALNLEGQQRAAFEAAARGQAPGRASRRNRLPADLTPLIGRSPLVATVCARLQEEEVRLLTLTGSPGVGKTRLALRVATELSQQEVYQDGVVFIPLAAVNSPSLVVSAIASTLDIREMGGEPLLTTIKDALPDKEILLILDNFEQVLDTAPQIVDLLTACPMLHVLVTSRAALHVRGECEFPVPPLELPDTSGSHPLSLDDLNKVPAIALFVARAQAVRPDFVLTVANASSVGQICIRLDGLPLAIELAAALIKLLPPQAIVTRLEHRLEALTSGPRDIPERQRTLRNTISWSYDLLDTTEQMLFRHLAIFSGGWTLEAAETICGSLAPGMPVMMDGLASLVDTSLVQVAVPDDSEPRFRMLETIREYAWEMLVSNGEEDMLRDRHFRYYLTVVEKAWPQFTSSERTMWLARLESEHDNLRAALRWTLDTGENERGLQMGALLGWFWSARGYFAEGREWMHILLARTEGSESTEALAARSKALYWAGELANGQGDTQLSLDLCERSLALCRYLGDTWGIAGILSTVGNTAREMADYRRAAELLDESIALSREVGDRDLLASALTYRGVVAQDLGDYEHAWALHQESLAVLHHVETQHDRSQWDRGNALKHLGEMAYAAGHDDQANAYLREALGIFQGLGEAWNTAYVLTVLGAVLCSQGDYEQAMALHNESRVRFQNLSSRQRIAQVDAHIADVESARGDARRALEMYVRSLRTAYTLGSIYSVARVVEGFAAAIIGNVVAEQNWQNARQAARLFGATAAYRTKVGLPVPLGHRPAHDHHVAATRTVLSDAEFTAAWMEGQAATIEQTVAWVLKLGEGV